MKVLLINGGPHKNGCTHTALEEVCTQLEKNGIETEIIWLGTEAIAGCIGCGYCYKNDACFKNDIVNEFVEKAKNADAFIFGSPVHYASSCASLCAFMDRVFYSADKDVFRGKPAAAVVSCRRGGASAAFDRINKYFTISGMPVVSSQYWNAVHGSNPEQVKQDLEGLQIMRALGSNMAWLLKCIEAGKNAGINLPETEKRVATNFIR